MPPKGERRKQQIIDTAKEMFIEKGFQSTHIGQICEKLDIARGTVYQYFSNKKEILYSILDSVIEKIEDTLDPDDLTEFLRTNPPKEVILKLIRKRVAMSISILLNEPITVMLIFKDIAGIDKEIVDKVNKSFNKIKKIIRKEIDRLKEKDSFRNNVDSNIVASMLLGGIMLMVYQYDKMDKDILEDETIKAMLDTYLYGALL